MTPLNPLFADIEGEAPDTEAQRQLLETQDPYSGFLVDSGVEISAEGSDWTATWSPSSSDHSTYQLPHQPSYSIGGVLSPLAENSRGLAVSGPDYSTHSHRHDGVSPCQPIGTNIPPTQESFDPFDTAILDIVPAMYQDPGVVALVLRQQSPTTADVHHRIRSAAPARTKAQPRRRGPLDLVKRDKAGTTRDSGACWRCRRYKKPCSGSGICKSCLTSGFRIWPSSLGCRRGDLEEIVAILVPHDTERILASVNPKIVRRLSWRSAVANTILTEVELYQVPTDEKWQRLSVKARATCMYGTEFTDLLEILGTYQRSQTKENSLLDAACTLVDSTCDMYNLYVASYGVSELSKLDDIVASVRTALARNFRLLVKACLSGRKTDWFPALLNSCLTICAIVSMTDMAVAVPEPARTMLWGNVPTLGNNLRATFYSMVRDLLSASTNGSNPLNLACWTLVEKRDLDGHLLLVRNPEGMKLAGQDTAIFDGFVSLQGWLKRNAAFLRLGELWYASDLYTLGVAPPTAAMAKLFRIGEK